MTERATVNRELLLPYLVPYLIYVGFGFVPETWLGQAENYWFRAASTGITLAWAWRRYVSILGPRSWGMSCLVGLGAGTLGLGLWIVLLLPFSGTAGPTWSAESTLARAIASGFIVPIFEELVMRGYILRVAFQWDQARVAGADDPLGEALDRRSINDVAPGSWTALAIAISTLAFMAGHDFAAWPAAVAYGLLMSGLWVLRKDLLSCIIAHGTTNLLLAGFVYETGHTGLW